MLEMFPSVLRTLMIRPEDVKPSRDDLTVVGTFNPGAAKLGDEVVLLVRIAERPREKRDGYCGLPRWEPEHGIVVDWVSENEIDWIDSRVIRKKQDGLVRLTFTSHLRVARSKDGRTIDRWCQEQFLPESEWEEYGVEDPRITQIGDTFYISYVAVSRHGAATALASTKDFESFVRHGIVFCPENKDVVLFPERIDGQYVALHRPNAATPFGAPEMWIARSPDLVHWGSHSPLVGGSVAWEGDRVGGGTPPIRTQRGWLTFYHGSARSATAGTVGAYSAGALLLDLDDPSRIVHRSGQAIFGPETDFERNGFVPNVVFPTGIVERDDVLHVYYGAADTCTAVAEISRVDVFAALG
jgi:predicted GH43/DUF377 family glycosyl hydrolase